HEATPATTPRPAPGNRPAPVTIAGSDYCSPGGDYPTAARHAARMGSPARPSRSSHEDGGHPGRTFPLRYRPKKRALEILKLRWTLVQQWSGPLPFPCRLPDGYSLDVLSDH